MYSKNNTTVEIFNTSLMPYHNDNISLTTIEIAELTGKRHDNVLRDTKTMLIELYGEKDALNFEGIYHDAYNREKPCYRLPKKEVLVLVSGYSIKLRMSIVTRLEELEAQRRNIALFLPDFTNPAEAARAWADQHEQKAIAEQQRDHAIATKAEISRRREATAMNTASQLSKENTRLKEQVGNAKTWKQARAIPWLGDFFILNNVAYAQIGRRLTKESRTLGIEPQAIEHSSYGTVKTYHADVIAHFKHKLIEDLNLMRKYRKY